MSRFVIALISSIYIAGFAGPAGAAAESKSPAKPLQVLKEKDRTVGHMVLENGLEVLLISNPSFQKDAAAMGVPAGNWSDPKEHQGLAHFLEHMTFLSTKDYPVGDYQKFLGENGGEHNAMTQDVMTRYFFEINPSGYEGALKRFSQFFSSPQFPPEYVEREKNAVHNEFQMYFQNEMRRGWAVLGDSTPESHPAHTFGVGSKETLKNVTHEVLMDFYQKYYSANTMKLILMSSRPVAEMRKLAADNFSSVPNRGVKKPDYESLPSQISGGRWIDAEAVTQVNRISIYFSTLPVATSWRTKPYRVLAALLGDEGKGSLVARLKSQNLIVKQDNVDIDVSGGQGAGSIMFDLTEKGAQNPQKIVEEVFAYINMLKREGVKPHVAEELKKILDLNFENRNVQEGGEYIAQLAYEYLMHKGSPLRLEKERNTILEVPSAEELRKWIDDLKPEHFLVVHQHPGAVTTKTEPYYGVKYSEQPFTPEFIQALNSASDPELSQPAPNPYIPRSFAIYKDAADGKPVAAVNDQRGTVFFAQEQRAIVRPLGYLTLDLISPLLVNSPRQQLIASLYVAALKDGLGEASYPMLTAGYKYEFKSTARGIRLTASGHSDGLMRVANDLISNGGRSLAKIELSDEKLNAFKDEVRKAFANRKKQDAYKTAVDYYRYLTSSNHALAELMEPELESISANEVRAFGEKFFARLRVEGLLYGNLHKASAETLVDSIFRSTGARPLTADQTAAVKLTRSILPAGNRLAYSLKGDNNNNAFISAYYSGENTPRNWALNQLVQKLWQSPYYTELRSNQQLGYGVWDVHFSNGEAAVQAFLIMSGEYEATELARRSNAYIETLAQQTAGLGSGQFNTLKQSLIEELEREQTSMEDEYERLNTIADDTKDFTRKEKVIAELKTMQAKDLQDFVKGTFGEKQARMTVYYNGEKFPASKGLPDETLIESKDDVQKRTGR